MIYSDRTSRNAIFVGPDHKTEHLQRIPLMQKTYDEAWIQRLIEKNPSLLQSEEIGSEFSDLICIGKEVKVGTGSSGYIDNLYVSATGRVVIVETKLFRNQESRRAVVAQIIDYAKDVQGWTLEDLDNVASEYTFHRRGQASRVFDLMLEAGYLTVEDSARFTDAVNRSLKNADFLLLIVGDGIRSGIEKLADFISSYTSNSFKLGLLELELYEHNGGTIVIPNVLTRTAVIERQTFTQKQVSQEPSVRTSTQPQPPVLSLEEFVRVFAANGNYESDSVLSFIASIRDLPGVSVTIHPSEVRIRIQLPDGSTCPILVFGKSGAAGKPAADIWVYPADIQYKLSKAGIPLYKANAYLDFYKVFVNQDKCKNVPYTVLSSFYYGYVRRILGNADAFMEAIEDLITSVSDSDE